MPRPKFLPLSPLPMSAAIPLFLVTPATFAEHPAQAWGAAIGFRGEPGQVCWVPDGAGGVASVLVGRSAKVDTWTLGGVANSLPAQTYELQGDWSPQEATHLALGWQLGQYRYDRFRTGDPSPRAELIPPPGVDQAYLAAAVAATYQVRNLINAPANILGPGELAAVAEDLAIAHGAEITVITGEDLLTANYPLIYRVGQASDRPPCLIDLRWGAADAPKVTLVGKGVCFDSGGLDIKPSQGMRLMKKDMGGAAHVLGLAAMIMGLELPIRLRMLIPAVENSISGNAMRPLDVLPSRRGITVEVGNTDAEGRLVLADALWEAAQERPELLIDLSTLTGAARVALGTEVPAFFCNHPDTAAALQDAAQSQDDPLWPLPLHAPYRDLLNSKVADISSISSGSYGGAITAALFLQEFVTPKVPWIHIDVMAWNMRSLPGRPEGGEAMGMRALFEMIAQRYPCLGK